MVFASKSAAKVGINFILQFSCSKGSLFCKSREDFEGIDFWLLVEHWDKYLYIQRYVAAGRKNYRSIILNVLLILLWFR